MEYRPRWKIEEEMDKRRELRRNILWAVLSLTLGVVIFADTLKRLGENRKAQYDPKAVAEVRAEARAYTVSISTPMKTRSAR